MDKIGIIIIEDNKDLCELLVNFIEREYPKELNVLGYANDGLMGVKLIEETHPDAVLIDLIIPCMDGLSVLQKVKSNPSLNSTACMILSSFAGEEITAQAFNYGADYFFMKPFEYRVLINRVKQIVHYKKNMAALTGTQPRGSNSSQEESMAEAYTRAILKELGIPIEIKGYFFLKRAIELSIENPSLLGALTKELYPAIGKEFGTAGSRVERSIRHAIDRAWEKGASAKYRGIIVDSSDEKYTKKPSSGALIMTLAKLYDKKR